MIKINNIIEGLDGISKKALNNSFVLVFFTLITLMGFYTAQFISLDNFLAVTGSSALHWLHVTSDASKNILDWSTGTRNLSKSLPMHIYSFFFYNTEIYLPKIIKIYIFFEILILSTSYYFLYRTLSNNNNNKILAIIFMFTVCFTTFQFMSLARFSSNFYWGLYYAFADAFRIIGLIFILKKCPWIAITSLSISVMIHPIMGGIGVIVGGALILFKGIKQIRGYFLPVLLMSIAVLSWLYIMYLGDGISGASIPTDSFLFFTKLYNSHWYPMYSGALNTIEYVHLLPTISIFMLYVMTSLTSQGAKYIVREAHIIILVLAILSSIGVLASFFDNTFIIKLSLHRASSFMVAIALIPIIIKLWNDIFNAKILYRSIAIYLLLSPFLDFKLPGFSLFFTLIYATHLLIQIKEEGSKKKIFTALTIWLIGVFALFYSAAPLYFNKIIQPSYDGIKLTLILIILMLISKYQPLNFIKNNKYLFQLISLILISIFIIKENMERTEGYRSERSSAYNETQVWAKINTRKDALFMIDPNFDGWRDGSQRASFGTANEWLHKAWLYDSDFKLFIEGQRRATLLNIDIPKLMNNHFTNFQEKENILRDLREVIRKSYYTSNESFYKNLSINEKIDYFVFENKYLANKPKGLKEIYKNKYFSIYK
jgi:hypothetical protein